MFYYGETAQRLKRLQKHQLNIGISTVAHGNTGRSPAHACSHQDKENIKQFIINYAAAHGMPDPGRDLRHGAGRLRILLPSVLNYESVHHAYELSLQSQNQPFVGYRTFIRCWQETCPYIVFNKPRTDLCMTCEEFKKEINKIGHRSNSSEQFSLIWIVLKPSRTRYAQIALRFNNNPNQTSNCKLLLSQNERCLK